MMTATTIYTASTAQTTDDKKQIENKKYCEWLLGKWVLIAMRLANENGLAEKDIDLSSIPIKMQVSLFFIYTCIYYLVKTRWDD
jgi:hypothetical protein